MTRPISKVELAQSRELAAAPQLKPNIRQDLEQRHFGLPVALHVAYFGLFFAYLGVMFLGLQSPDMILPMAIFVIFTAAFYIVPMAWARMRPETSEGSAPTMGELERNGIMTHTGLCSARDAVIQVLLLPGLILGWGIATVTIAATV